MAQEVHADMEFLHVGRHNCNGVLVFECFICSQADGHGSAAHSAAMSIPMLNLRKIQRALLRLPALFTLSMLPQKSGLCAVCSAFWSVTREYHFLTVPRYAILLRKGFLYCTEMSERSM